MASFCVLKYLIVFFEPCLRTRHCLKYADLLSLFCETWYLAAFSFSGSTFSVSFCVGLSSTFGLSSTLGAGLVSVGFGCGLTGSSLLTSLTSAAFASWAFCSAFNCFLAALLARHLLNNPIK